MFIQYNYNDFIPTIIEVTLIKLITTHGFIEELQHLIQNNTSNRFTNIVTLVIRFIHAQCAPPPLPGAYTYRMVTVRAYVNWQVLTQRSPFLPWVWSGKYRLLPCQKTLVPFRGQTNDLCKLSRVLKPLDLTTPLHDLAILD